MTLAKFRKLFVGLAVLFCIFAAKGVFAQNVYIVTALDPLEAKEYFKAFEEDTKIKASWIRLSAGEALARLKSEEKNPTLDVFFGAPAPELIAAKSAGLLEPYSSAATREIPEKWRDKDNYWTGVYFGLISFITGRGLNPPKTWADLLDPKYKGEIVVSYPYTAGTGYTILAGLAALMGDEGAIDYYKKLDGQIRRYTKSGGAPIIEVGLGEAGVGIVFEQDAIRKGRSRGFPLTITLPEDGVPFEVGGVGIVKGHKSKDAAKFVDWIVSVKAQNIMQKWYRIPIHPKAVVGEGLHDLGSVKLAPMTMEFAGNKREELLRLWREKIGK